MITFPQDVQIEETGSPSDSFRDAIERECVAGSAIALDVYRDAVEIVEDTGLWEPNRALNQHVSRFWQTKSAHQYGSIAMFVNEDGTYWQGKAENPKYDAKKGKTRKYDTPVDNGSRGFLPKVNLRMRRRIARYYNITDPTFISTRASRKRGIKTVPFWDWIEAHPEIRIVITEGGKKSLCLLSLGVVAIALYGVKGGYVVKDLLSNPIPPKLIADIARFAAPGRRVDLAFDQDADPGTRLRVAAALSKFGGLLERSGCEVSIVEWDAANGKGVDDLIVKMGAEAWVEASAGAELLTHWQIAQKLRGRLDRTPASLRAVIHDLSSLDPASIPDSGIVAIASPKGTGKTKFIGRAIEGKDKALSVGHRITLQRNLAERLGLEYIRDAERRGGRFVGRATYTLRVTTVVDSVLKINPDDVAGGDLVLDEICQLVRHLLTSDTCKKEGKRPVLLARFAELVKRAKRVILADADLDSDTIGYISHLRGDGQQPFLIRNDLKPEGYPVRYVDAPNKSAIVGELIETAAALPMGQVLYVCTDSMGRDLAGRFPDKRVLLINSETSGGKAEQEFIKTPDAVLARGEYDLIIVSPTLATGISIEIPGRIRRVFGIFSGHSLIDSDVAQSLGRVRENVPRTVWVAETGRNFSKISSSSNPLEIEKALRESTSATVGLIRSQLRADTLATVAAYDWAADPHLKMYSRIEARRNAAMWSLRSAVMVRLKEEGNILDLVSLAANEAVMSELKVIRDYQQQQRAEGIVAAAWLSFSDVLRLESKESTSPDEQLAIERFQLCDFYQIRPDELTTVDVLSDKNGRRRGELLALEGQLYPESAEGRSLNSLLSQLGHGQNLTPWDISGAKLKQELRTKLGLDQFLIPGATWRKGSSEVRAIASKARQYAKTIKDILGFRITDAMSDCQILGQLLHQLGITTEFYWGRVDGKKTRIYRIHAVGFAELQDILDRRQKMRQEIQKIAGMVDDVAIDVAIDDCVDMARFAVETDDNQAIAETLEILQEALRESPDAKREVWARLSIEHQSRLKEAKVA
jgi:Domain of unknown function (DUF3854)